MQQFFTDWDVTQYLVEHFDRVWPRVVEHLTIVGLSLLVGIIIALPLGLFLSRTPRLAGPIVGIFDVVYTFPGLAVFAFLLTIPGIGIGLQPAVIALASYSLFILVRNTVVAYNGVDPAIIEAAKGMGMSGAQRLWKVETPLAMPVILAGLRIATLSTIGLATIAAWVGAGGLGQLLREGINNPSKLYAGVLCVALMAIGFDLAFRFVERRVGIPNPSRNRAPRASEVVSDLAQPKEA